MPTKTKGCGSILSYNAVSSGAYTAITSLMSIKPPGSKRGTIVNTDLDTVNCVETTQAGRPVGSEMTFKGYFTKAQSDTLLALYYAGTDNYYWKISFPLIDSESVKSSYGGQGFLSGIDWDEINTDENNMVTHTFTVMPSGAWDIIPGTP